MTQVVPFVDEMLPAAGELLAMRHRCYRQARPPLSARFEDPAATRAAVEAAWRRDRASGVAAFVGGRLAAYLIGDTVIDTLWGRSAWVRAAGCSLAPGQDPELLRDLYAAVAAPWVSTHGCFDLYAQVPATDEPLLRQWSSLCFGTEQVYAVLGLQEADFSSRGGPPGVEIRRAGPGDRTLLEDFSDIISRELVLAPCWAARLPELEQGQRRDWGGLVDEAATKIWLAFAEGRPAAVQAYYPAEDGETNVLLPDRCVHLAVAGTRPWARRRGIASAVTLRALAELRGEGFLYCDTDWRSTNLTASRCWPKQGFQPMMYRLSRRVDSRIAWAHSGRA